MSSSTQRNGSGQFVKGFEPWNKGKKGIQKAWNKDKKMPELSKKYKGAGNPMYGKPSWNKGLKGYGREWNKNHPPTAEQKKKISETLKRKYSSGEIMHPKGMKGKIPHNKGKRLDDIYDKETAERLRKINIESHKGKPSHRKGLRLEEEYADKAEEIRMKIKLARSKQKFPVKSTIPEKMIWAELDKINVTYEKHKTIIFEKGKGNFVQPDAFIEPNVCIFCDGDFHHANPAQYSADDYIWKSRNVKAKDIRLRDSKINDALKKLGYIVKRFWASRIKRDVSGCIDEIKKVIKTPA